MTELLRKLVVEYEVDTGQLDEAGQSIKQTKTQTIGAIRSTEQLEQSMKDLGVQSFKVKKATDDVGATMRALRREQQLAKRAQDQLNGSMNQMRGIAQNAGWQIQDVVVQMQMGTNAATIFSQQGSQFVGAFNPLAGAVIAIAGAIGGAFIPSLIKGEEEVRDMIVAGEDWLDNIEKLTEAQIRWAKIQLSEELAEVNSQIQEQANLADSLLARANTQSQFGDINEAQKLRAEATKHEAERDALIEQRNQLEERGNFLSEQSAKIHQVINTEAAAIADQYRLMAEYQAEAAKHPASTLKGLEEQKDKAEEVYNATGALGDQYILMGEAMAGALKNPASTMDDLAAQSETTADRIYDSLKAASEGTGDLWEEQIGRFTEGWGDALETAVFDSENLGDAVGNVFEGMARSMVAYFGEWAANRAVMWALEQFYGAAAGASYVTEVAGRGAAETNLGALNAAASTAAIPIIGPALAPGAAATFAALGTALTTQAVAAATAGFAGGFDSGGAIPAGKWGIAAELGPELVNGVLVEGPARVTSRQETAQRLGQGGGGVGTLNVYGVTDPEMVGRVIERRLRRPSKRLATNISHANAQGNRNRGIR